MVGNMSIGLDMTRPRFEIVVPPSYPDPILWYDSCDWSGGTPITHAEPDSTFRVVGSIPNKGTSGPTFDLPVYMLKLGSQIIVQSRLEDSTTGSPAWFEAEFPANIWPDYWGGMPSEAPCFFIYITGKEETAGLDMMSQARFSFAGYENNGVNDATYNIRSDTLMGDFFPLEHDITTYVVRDGVYEYEQMESDPWDGAPDDSGVVDGWIAGGIEVPTEGSWLSRYFTSATPETTTNYSDYATFDITDMDYAVNFVDGKVNRDTTLGWESSFSAYSPQEVPPQGVPFRGIRGMAFFREMLTYEQCQAFVNDFCATGPTPVLAFDSRDWSGGAAVPTTATNPAIAVGTIPNTGSAGSAYDINVWMRKFNSPDRWEFFTTYFSTYNATDPFTIPGTFWADMGGTPMSKGWTICAVADTAPESGSGTDSQILLDMQGFGPPSSSTASMYLFYNAFGDYYSYAYAQSGGDGSNYNYVQLDGNSPTTGTTQSLAYDMVTGTYEGTINGVVINPPSTLDQNLSPTSAANVDAMPPDAVEIGWGSNRMTFVQPVKGQKFTGLYAWRLYREVLTTDEVATVIAEMQA